MFWLSTEWKLFWIVSQIGVRESASNTTRWMHWNVLRCTNRSSVWHCDCIRHQPRVVSRSYASSPRKHQNRTSINFHWSTPRCQYFEHRSHFFYSNILFSPSPQAILYFNHILKVLKVKNLSARLRPPFLAAFLTKNVNFIYIFVILACNKISRKRTNTQINYKF